MKNECLGGCTSLQTTVPPRTKRAVACTAAGPLESQNLCDIRYVIFRRAFSTKKKAARGKILTHDTRIVLDLLPGQQGCHVLHAGLFGAITRARSTLLL